MSGGPLKSQLLFLGLVLSLGVGVSHADQPKARAKRPVPHAEPAPPPIVPIVPLRPEQMPATPPVVTFTGGQLKITAENSTLGDILREVRNQTGANVDVPGNATERVMGTFGPGPARDVLSSLLNGSHFNYVLMGSASSPVALDRVILTMKTSSPDRPAEQAAAQPSPPPQSPEPQGGEALFGDDQADQNQDSSDIFGNADEQNTQAEDQQQNPFGQPSDVRTPEQMLQDLQRQQQQGQAGQQPGSQPNPFGNPNNPFRPPRPNIPTPPQPSPQ